MSKPDPCRFCRIYAIAVAAFAAVIGALTTLQFVLSVGSKYGAGSYASSVLVLSVVRSLATAANGSALLLALVLWAHPLTAAQLAADLRRILTRALVVSGPGYVVAGVVAVAAGFAVAGALGQPWTQLKAGFAIATARDFGMGLLATLVDTALIVFLAWRYLARLQAGGTSLPAKLIVVVSFSVGLRATAGLLVSMLLSA